MYCESEFRLLKETFKKSRIQIIEASLDSKFTEILDDAAKPLFENLFSASLSLQETLGDLKTGTLYRFKDSLMLSYIAFLMPIDEVQKIILIGPYTDEPFYPERILDISERNGIPPKSQRIINEFFAAIPVLPENSPLFLLLEAFCEGLWNGNYELVDIQGSAQLLENVVTLPAGTKEIDDTFIDMENMARRYELENKIMDAVATGSEHKVNQLFSNFTETSFEMRLSDPLRNYKNYCVIMNTLLRKAAERGGVHPIYLDRISSKYALEIEQLTMTNKVQPLMFNMFRAYCNLVRKNSAKAYSPIVKKAVIAIETDLSAELNLHILADALSVSKVYLSSVFKKETGKTVTEYIREKRLSYAANLLKTTHLQIQAVALHCGMVDVQYFSKLFKQYTGKTPTQYRAENNPAHN